MFEFLYDIYNKFLYLTSNLEFNGRPLLAWALGVFALSAIIRFVLPLLGMPHGMSLFTYVRGRSSKVEPEEKHSPYFDSMEYKYKSYGQRK